MVEENRSCSPCKNERQGYMLSHSQATTIKESGRFAYSGSGDREKCRNNHMITNKLNL
jgi:hypothetical protein